MQHNLSEAEIYCIAPMIFSWIEDLGILARARCWSRRMRAEIDLILAPIPMTRDLKCARCARWMLSTARGVCAPCWRKGVGHAPSIKLDNFCGRIHAIARIPLGKELQLIDISRATYGTIGNLVSDDMLASAPGQRIYVLFHSFSWDYGNDRPVDDEDLLEMDVNGYNHHEDCVLYASIVSEYYVGLIFRAKPKARERVVRFDDRLYSWIHWCLAWLSEDIFDDIKDFLRGLPAL